MLSKYDLQKLIGTGTFGNVYLVRSRANGNSYVLKEVQIRSMTPAERQQALTEVTVLARCRHRNIIRYKEAAIEHERGMLCIVMEYAECGDMYAAIKRQQGVYFKECDVISWFVQITLALRYIHTHNILHRDLKTQNIFLTSNKLVKVGDFGIARVLKEDKELATTSIGTPYYLSPEICQRKPYNCKSDIWALGCVLFEMTALMHPFQGQNFHQLVCAILKVQYRELPSNTNPLIRDLIKLLLAADPEKRPSADEILAMPALQPHLFRYINFCTPSKSTEVADSLFASSGKKHNGYRRFSSDDVLDIVNSKPLDATPVSGRRSSLSSANKSSIRIKQCGLASLKASSKSTPNHGHQRSVKSRSHKSPNTETKTSKRRASSPRAPHLSPKRIEYPEKDAVVKNGVSLTYTLFRKALGKGEKPVDVEKKTGSRSPTRRKNIQSICNGENDHHSCESACVSLATKHNDLCPSIYKPDSQVISAEGILHRPDEDVFAMRETIFDSKPLCKSSCSSMQNLTDIQCPHASQCFQCVLDTLWKNRIRSLYDVDETQRTKLRCHLQSVFGKDRFQEIYRKLAKDWTSASPDEDRCMHVLLQSLSFDQKQSVPLLVQLLQLDLIKKESPVGF